jgi:hypothetical protein
MFQGHFHGALLKKQVLTWVWIHLDYLLFTPSQEDIDSPMQVASHTIMAQLV